MYSGGYLYAAGQFTELDSVNRNGLIKFDQAGNVVTGWNPGSTMSGGGGYASVLAVAGSKVFVGGSFTSIGGQSVSNLAAIDTGTGVASSSWSPNPNNYVTALAVAGSRLFVGGNFTFIGGSSVNNLAAIDITTGNSVTWDAKLYNTPSTVNVWTISPIGNCVFVGGLFFASGQTTRNGLGSIDFTTGRITSWNPNATGGSVNAICLANEKLIAGGSFTNVGAGNLSIPNLAAFDTSTGLPIQSPSWKGTAGGTVHALLGVGDRLYVAGDFFGLDGYSRAYLGDISKNDGTLLPWHPILDNGGVWSLASSGSKVFASGFFNHIGGVARGYAAAFDTTIDSLTAWDPEPGYLCFSLATLGNKVYLGGSFYGVGGNSSIKSLAAVDTATGALISGFNANFYLALTVYAMAAAGSDLIIGGTISSSYSPNRSALAILNANTGAVNSFNAHMNEDVSSAIVYSIALGEHTFVIGGQFVAPSCYPEANLAGYADDSIEIGPKLKIVPDTLVFPIFSGSHEDSTVTLFNIGVSDLHISNALSTASIFTARPTSTVIPPGGSAIDTIRYAPTTISQTNGLILYQSDCPTNPDTLWLTGEYDLALSVDVTSFEALTDPGYVKLSWKTQSEVENAGFIVLREDPGASSFKLLASYVSDEALKGMGTSTSGRGYGFTDAKVKSGATYRYKIQNTSTNGTTKDLSTLSVTVNIPKEYALYQNYPNPFNPSTTIQFDLRQTSTVTLEIYNVLGERVEQWSYGSMGAGKYNEDINMDTFASGVYFYRILAVGNDGQRFVSMKKLVLIK